MSTSPDRRPARPGRILRGGAAVEAARLAFPRIAPSAPVAAAPAAPSAVEPPAAVDEELLEHARLEAAARGYADGFAAGRDDAIAQHRGRAAELLAALDAAVSAQAAQQRRSFDELSADLAALAIGTVEALLGRELSVAEDAVRDALDRALRLAPDATTAARVHVHPDDAALLAGSAPASIEIVEDAGVEPGGCVVHVDGGEIDAQLGPALERVRAVLA